MESGQTIIQKEVGDRAEQISSSKFPRKRLAVKGNRNRRPAGHKRSRKYATNRAALSKELKEKPILRCGVVGLWRIPTICTEAGMCSICADEEHMEHFCPFYYIYGRYEPLTCRAECPPGQHTITSMDNRRSLQNLIRVNNMPPSFTLGCLRDLFKPFGRLLMWDVPKLVCKRCRCLSSPCRGYGAVVFKNHEDGERAIDELNGYVVDGQKLRVDWAYPSV